METCALFPDVIFWYALESLGSKNPTKFISRQKNIALLVLTQDM